MKYKYGTIKQYYDTSYCKKNKKVESLGCEHINMEHSIT